MGEIISKLEYTEYYLRRIFPKHKIMSTRDFIRHHSYIIPTSSNRLHFFIICYHIEDIFNYPFLCNFGI